MIKLLLKSKRAWTFLAGIILSVVMIFLYLHREAV